MPSTDYLKWTTADYQFDANIHSAAACVLWSGKFDGDEYAVIRRNVKIAVLITNFLQTVCLCALSYFVFTGESSRPRRASEWIFEIPKGKELSVVFFACFVVVGVVVGRKEVRKAYAANDFMFWSWWIQIMKTPGNEKEISKFWWFQITKYPLLLAEFGGFAYLMVFCTRFDASEDSQQYIEYVLNLLAFDFVFEIDDWIFQIMEPEWKQAGIWKDEFLRVNVKKPTPKVLRGAVHRQDDVLLAFMFAPYCVCSRFAFVFQAGFFSYHLLRMILRSCRKKSIWYIWDITLWWTVLSLTLGTFCVLGDDDTIVPFVCYCVGTLLFLFGLMVELRHYHHAHKWHTWWLVNEKSDN